MDRERNLIRESLQQFTPDEVLRGLRIFEEWPNNDYFCNTPEINEGRDKRPFSQVGRCFIGSMGGNYEDYSRTYQEVTKGRGEAGYEAASILSDAYESPELRPILKEEALRYLEPVPAA